MIKKMRLTQVSYNGIIYCDRTDLADFLFYITGIREQDNDIIHCLELGTYNRKPLSIIGVDVV